MALVILYFLFPNKDGDLSAAYLTHTPYSDVGAAKTVRSTGVPWT
jgi:hypothetical protein